MTTQLKADIKTIAEVASFILFNAALIIILESHSVAGYIFKGLLLIFYGWYVWRRYFKKNTAAIFLFPTVNDSYVNFIPVLFTVFLMLFSAITLFRFSCANLFLLIRRSFRGNVLPFWS
jgi:hypothetical protein